MVGAKIRFYINDYTKNTRSTRIELNGVIIDSKISSDTFKYGILYFKKDEPTKQRFTTISLQQIIEVDLNTLPFKVDMVKDDAVE